MKKLYISFIAAIVMIFLIAPNWENKLRGESSYPQNDQVGQAIEKSILWASDGQIRKLLNMVEQKYGRDIREISKKHNISPRDITAIAIVESLLDEDAESHHGALGLMGVKRATGKEMGFDDIECPINNLKAGTKYYKALLKKFKDRELALAAYNLGPGEVESRLTRGFNPETIDYIWKIRRVRQLVI